MTSAELPAGLRARFDELAAELTRLGLAEDGDFFISGRVPSPAPSSEIIGLTFRDDVFEVWYRDMGAKSSILTTGDFDEARETFAREAVHLAGQRGRGPEAGAR